MQDCDERFRSLSPAFNFLPTLRACVEAGSRAADKMLETQFRLTTLPTLSQNHLWLLLRQCSTFKSIHDMFLVILKTVQPVLWQTSGRGEAELTALNMAAAESRPNRFCV